MSSLSDTKQPNEYYTCTAKCKVIPRCWAEFDTAHIGFGFNAGNGVIQVRGPQLDCGEIKRINILITHSTAVNLDVIVSYIHY